MNHLVEVKIQVQLVIQRGTVNNYDDTSYSNGSDSEPSATSSSPEHVKVKHVKQKNVQKVKRMKRKKGHPKVAYDTSDGEMDVTPKKRLKVKKLRRCPKVKKEVEKKGPLKMWQET